MEQSRHTKLSTIESHGVCLEKSNTQIRQPLTSSAGNSQLYTLASGHYFSGKGEQLPFDEDGNIFPFMTLPSQTSNPSQPAGYTLHQRKDHLRNQREQRQMKQIRNPIVDSPQYQAYRERATREGNPDDQKWPDILEDAFLDALLIMPVMGRRKFSFKGKPHGRNELIAEYLWIYYLQSLGPGEIPDTSMRRLRKQVSSHIQVIKGFLKTHPDVHKLFPKSPKPESGFQDSFKNDPCLRAISEGRLPSKKYGRFNNNPQYIEDSESLTVSTTRHGPIRPCMFWLLITSQELPEDQSACSELHDLFRENMVAHTFSNLSTEISHGTLNNIPDWQHKFPKLAHLWFMGDLNCDIIHMNVALELMGNCPGKGAELCCRTEVMIPKTTPAGCEWMLRSTFTKPAELCRNGIPEPSSEEASMTELSQNETESRFKLPFPARSWAFAITKLIDMQNDQKLHQTQNFNNSPVKTARKCLEETSMYQEILCSTNLPASGHRPTLIRKAIIIWTFQQTLGMEAGNTTWRYIDATKARRTIMSPSPPVSATYHQDSSLTYGGFSPSFEDQTPLHLQHPSMLSDSFSQGLATPPLSGCLSPPFNTKTYNPYAFNHTFPFADLSSENSAFASSRAGDSESTFTDEAQHTAEIDHYLSTNSIFANHENWLVPVNNSSNNFDTGSGWGGYGVPSQHADWEEHPTSVPSSQLTKPHEWQDLLSQQRHQQQKTLSWIVETSTTTNTSPDLLEKQDGLAEHQGTLPHYTNVEFHERGERESFMQQQPWLAGTGGCGDTGRANETQSGKNSCVVDVRDKQEGEIATEGSMFELASSSGGGGGMNAGGERAGGMWVVGNESFPSGYDSGLT